MKRKTVNVYNPDKSDANPAELINDWTIDHLKEILVLVDADGKEIDYTVRREDRKKK